MSKLRKLSLVLSLGLVVAALIFSASPSTPSAQALVNYPPAALLQPGDITGTMIRNGAIGNVHINASDTLSGYNATSGSPYQVVTNGSQTLYGAKTFNTTPIIPSSSAVADTAPVDGYYFRTNAVSVTNANLTTTGASSTQTKTFTTAATTTTWTVPPGVTSLTINAHGAQGNQSAASAGTQHGYGGSTTGTVTVTPGQNIYIFIGNTGAGDGTSLGSGGSGGDGYNHNPGAGGQATWVSPSSTLATSTMWILAGGGGGGGGQGNGQSGGYGGQAGLDPGNTGDSGQSAGGAGGTNCGAGAAGAGNANGGGGGGGAGDTCFGSGVTATSTATSSWTGAGQVTLTYVQPTAALGNNYGGTVTIGATTSAVTVLFSQTFGVAPGCSFTPSVKDIMWGTSTVSQFTANASTSMSPGYSFMYTCL